MNIKILNLIFILIGLVFANIQGAYADLSDGLERDPAAEELQIDAGDGMIEVEPIGVEAELRGGKYRLYPYPERRPKWTMTYGLSWSDFNPTNYDSEFSAETYETIFAVENSSMFELEISAQRNFGFGSIALDFGLGAYNANAADEYVDVTTDSIKMSIIPLRAGAKFNLDTLFDTPYVVPYVGAGFYIMFYSEKLNTRSVDGSTSPSFYYNAGLKFQMDWFEPDKARKAYQEYGLQNTYLFVEARQFMESFTEADPNFSNDISLTAGISLEL